MPAIIPVSAFASLKILCLIAIWPFFLSKLTRMKTRHTFALPSPDPESSDFPDHAALRGWYARLSTRQAVERYLNEHLAPGASARAIICRNWWRCCSTTRPRA